MAEVRERLSEENKDFEFTDDPVRLEIHSPDVQNVTLVDLPGYIHVSFSSLSHLEAVKTGQERDIPKKIQKLCRNYTSYLILFE